MSENVENKNLVKVGQLFTVNAGRQDLEANYGPYRALVEFDMKEVLKNWVEQNPKMDQYCYSHLIDFAMYLENQKMAEAVEINHEFELGIYRFSEFYK